MMSVSQCRVRLVSMFLSVSALFLAALSLALRSADSHGTIPSQADTLREKRIDALEKRLFDTLLKKWSKPKPGVEVRVSPDSILFHRAQEEHALREDIFDRFGGDSWVGAHPAALEDRFSDVLPVSFEEQDALRKDAKSPDTRAKEDLAYAFAHQEEPRGVIDRWGGTFSSQYLHSEDPRNLRHNVEKVNLNLKAKRSSESGATSNTPRSFSGLALEASTEEEINQFALSAWFFNAHRKRLIQYTLEAATTSPSTQTEEQLERACEELVPSESERSAEDEAREAEQRRQRIPTRGGRRSNVSLLAAEARTSSDHRTNRQKYISQLERELKKLESVPDLPNDAFGLAANNAPMIVSTTRAQLLHDPTGSARKFFLRWKTGKRRNRDAVHRGRSRDAVDAELQSHEQRQSQFWNLNVKRVRQPRSELIANLCIVLGIPVVSCRPEKWFAPGSVWALYFAILHDEFARSSDSVSDAEKGVLGGKLIRKSGATEVDGPGLNSEVPYMSMFNRNSLGSGSMGDVLFNIRAGPADSEEFAAPDAVNVLDALESSIAANSEAADSESSRDIDFDDLHLATAEQRAASFNEMRRLLGLESLDSGLQKGVATPTAGAGGLRNLTELQRVLESDEFKGHPESVSQSFIRVDIELVRAAAERVSWKHDEVTVFDRDRDDGFDNDSGAESLSGNLNSQTEMGAGPENLPSGVATILDIVDPQRSDLAARWKSKLSGNDIFPLLSRSEPLDIEAKHRLLLILEGFIYLHTVAEVMTQIRTVIVPAVVLAATERAVERRRDDATGSRSSSDDVMADSDSPVSALSALWAVSHDSRIQNAAAVFGGEISTSQDDTAVMERRLLLRDVRRMLGGSDASSTVPDGKTDYDSELWASFRRSSTQLLDETQTTLVAKLVELRSLFAAAQKKLATEMEVRTVQLHRVKLEQLAARITESRFEKGTISVSDSELRCLRERLLMQVDYIAPKSIAEIENISHADADPDAHGADAAAPKTPWDVLAGRQLIPQLYQHQYELHMSSTEQAREAFWSWSSESEPDLEFERTRIAQRYSQLQVQLRAIVCARVRKALHHFAALYRALPLLHYLGATERPLSELIIDYFRKMKVKVLTGPALRERFLGSSGEPHRNLWMQWREQLGSYQILHRTLNGTGTGSPVTQAAGASSGGVTRLGDLGRFRISESPGSPKRIDPDDYESFYSPHARHRNSYSHRRRVRDADLKLFFGGDVNSMPLHLFDSCPPSTIRSPARGITASRAAPGPGADSSTSVWTVTSTVTNQFQVPLFLLLDGKIHFLNVGSATETLTRARAQAVNLTAGPGNGSMSKPKHAFDFDVISAQRHAEWLLQRYIPVFGISSDSDLVPLARFVRGIREDVEKSARTRQFTGPGMSQTQTNMLRQQECSTESRRRGPGPDGSRLQSKSENVNLDRSLERLKLSKASWPNIFLQKAGSLAGRTFQSIMGVLIPSGGENWSGLNDIGLNGDWTKAEKPPECESESASHKLEKKSDSGTSTSHSVSANPSSWFLKFFPQTRILGGVGEDMVVTGLHEDLEHGYLHQFSTGIRRRDITLGPGDDGAVVWLGWPDSLDVRPSELSEIWGSAHSIAVLHQLELFERGKFVSFYASMIPESSNAAPRTGRGSDSELQNQNSLVNLHQRDLLVGGRSYPGWMNFRVTMKYFRRMVEKGLAFTLEEAFTFEWDLVKGHYYPTRFPRPEPGWSNGMRGVWKVGAIKMELEGSGPRDVTLPLTAVRAAAIDRTDWVGPQIQIRLDPLPAAVPCIPLLCAGSAAALPQDGHTASTSSPAISQVEVRPDDYDIDWRSFKNHMTQMLQFRAAMEPFRLSLLAPESASREIAEQGIISSVRPEIDAPVTKPTELEPRLAVSLSQLQLEMEQAIAALDEAESPAMPGGPKIIVRVPTQIEISEAARRKERLESRKQIQGLRAKATDIKTLALQREAELMEVIRGLTGTGDVAQLRQKIAQLQISESSPSTAATNSNLTETSPITEAPVDLDNIVGGNAEQPTTPGEYNAKNQMPGLGRPSKLVSL